MKSAEAAVRLECSDLGTDRGRSTIPVALEQSLINEPQSPATLTKAKQSRRLRGASAWATGAAAEENVARLYEARGGRVAARRWRSPFGELDLVIREGATVVAVEVKKARSLDEAAHRLSRRQIDRLCAAAALFCEGEPRGSLTDLRFDLALVDWMGRARILENAWGADW